MKLSGKPEPILPLGDIDEFETILKKYYPEGHQKLTDNCVLEVGFGARPWRLISLTSLGVDIYGIDLDQPAYGWNPKRLLKILKRNGFERFSKSLIRGLFFDGPDLRRLKKELKQYNRSLLIEDKRMSVGNASETHHFKAGFFTFGFSCDVFEHIPAEALPLVVKNIKTWMAKGSIFVVRPHVFTGISGGHHPDFYAHKVVNGTVDAERAWAHLWDPDYKVNTYLNKVRLSDYIRIFSAEFEILEMKEKLEKLGSQYLTPDMLKKLTPEYTEEDLFANEVLFVLRS